MKKRSFRSAALAVVALALVATPVLTTTARASDPFLGEIKMVGFGFAPRGYAKCDGQLLSISQNTALFALMGTTFGGDGETTFALPDLRGRHAKHVGNGPGLSTVQWGQKGGAETVSLTTSQIPSHNHGVAAKLRGTSAAGNVEDPASATLAQENREDQYRSAAPDVDMASGSVTVTQNNVGGNQGHENRPPYLGIYHVIATQGLFPSQN